jgi:ferrous iron transport protein B
VFAQKEDSFMEEKKVTIALAGNPNCGKTTLFNALTGSNQFVGNWPGVTVEKKEGKLKGHKDVTITDLPGIYSLSPYTLEEVVSRNYLVQERPDVILNIIDGTNLERNLYLTTQLVELGIPVLVAVNMMDIVRKNGDKINTQRLAKELDCQVVEISALKGDGVTKAAEQAVALARSGQKTIPQHRFAGCVEHALAHIEEVAVHELPAEQQRWYAIKLFERDEKILEQLNLQKALVDHLEGDIAACEQEMDDDAESIITAQRYDYISSIIDHCYTRQSVTKLSTSDKIDRIVTNRWLALPIFAIIMFLVYYVSVTTVGSWATDWANDGVFGDGWHLFAIGSGAYNDAADEYGGAANVVQGFIDDAAENGIDTETLEAALDLESEDFDEAVAAQALADFAASYDADYEITYGVEDEETLAVEDETATTADLLDAVDVLADYGYAEPDPADYGVWIPGIPVLIERALNAIGCADWLSGLILDGIVAGVGAVLGFVPQMLVLFIFLAFLESCGYMARIAFILDRVFRKFGLSGKSFIPILIGTGCGVPGIMASRTIENERDRRMTIMTTTFIPCGAKLPFIAMIAGAIFGGNPWIAPSAYFLGIVSIICSGIILKKTKLFIGDPAPFVMELPAYHMPTVGTVLRSMWERGWSFIKKAGTIILLSTILVWFLSYFGFVDGSFTMLAEDELDRSILAIIGSAICWIFAPLGFGNWQATVASITGLIAKENIVGTLGILYGAGEGTVYATMSAAFTGLSGYAFLAFNLLCAPCFAAMGAIKREMNSSKWFWTAIGYQCGFAYLVALVIYQVGSLFMGRFGVGTVVAIAVIVAFLYLLFRPATQVVDGQKVKVSV